MNFKWLVNLTGTDNIKKKYYELMKKYHPDKHTNENNKIANESCTKEINVEYEYICRNKITTTVVQQKSYESPRNPFWSGGEVPSDGFPDFDEYVKRKRGKTYQDSEQWFNANQNPFTGEPFNKKNKAKEESNTETQFERECKKIDEAFNTIVRTKDYNKIPERNKKAYIFTTITSLLLETGTEIFTQHYEYLASLLVGNGLEMHTLAKHWYRIYQNLK